VGEVKRRNLFALILILLVGYMLADLVLEMPEFGNPDSPANTHVIPRYLKQGLNETGATNIVTAVLFDYRAYDTLGEATVLFAAALAILSFIGGEE
jgi:multisubunit Na+/H+ antiporter MnhB subunit